jgi:hypothetical protein
MIPIDGSRVSSTDAAPYSTDTVSVSADIAPVSQLLERRNQVQGWLGRLDELASECAAHIAARVRADYEDRLASFLAELAAHLDSLRADAERLRADFDAARAQHEDAVDSLEEVRLRYRIGEIEEEQWEARRGLLEEEVATTAAARDSAASELQRLDALVAQIEASTGSSRRLLPEIAISRVGASESSEAQAQVESGDDVVDIADLEMAPASDEETVPEPSALLADLDYPWEIALPAVDGDRADADAESALPPADFLQELDRALNDESVEDPAFTLTEAELDTRPKPGVKCPDCGYTNDPQAWYCGVCGADLN